MYIQWPSSLDVKGLDSLQANALKDGIHDLLPQVTLAMARMRNQEPDGEAYKATQSEVHLRSAKRLLHVCQVRTSPIYSNEKRGKHVG